MITRSINSGSASICSRRSAPAHPAVALSDFWAISWHKFFSSPILQLVSYEQLHCARSHHQQLFGLSIFHRIEQFPLLVLCCHLSVLLMFVRWATHYQRWFCLQKKFCARQRLTILTLHCLERPDEISHVSWWHCHGVYHKNEGIRLSDNPCFRLREEFRKHILSRQPPAPQSITAKAWHCKSAYTKDQGKRLSVSTGCSIASTARKKLVSLL